MVESCLRPIPSIKKTMPFKKQLDLSDLILSIPDSMICDMLDTTLEQKGIQAFKEELLQLNISRKTLIPLMNRYMREYKTDVIKEILALYRNRGAET